jgi:hypothetical protein
MACSLPRLPSLGNDTDGQRRKESQILVKVAAKMDADFVNRVNAVGSEYHLLGIARSAH